jgi:hypothetical protein
MRFDVAKVVNMTMFRTTFMSLDAAFQNKDCKKHVQQISKPVNLAHFDWICTGTNPYNKDIYWLFTLTFWSIAFFLSIFFFSFFLFHLLLLSFVFLLVLVGCISSLPQLAWDQKFCLVHGINISFPIASRYCRITCSGNSFFRLWRCHIH